MDFLLNAEQIVIEAKWLGTDGLEITLSEEPPVRINDSRNLSRRRRAQLDERHLQLPNTLSLPDVPELSLGNSQSKVTSNPARSVAHRREDDSRLLFLTVDEERSSARSLKPKGASHLAELDLAINGGMRKGSQYGLTWDMVDFNGRMLNIPRTKNEEPIHVPLDDAAIAALRVVHDRGDVRGRVFQSAKTGEPLENGRHGSTKRLWKLRSRTFVGTTCGIRLQVVCE